MGFVSTSSPEPTPNFRSAFSLEKDLHAATIPFWKTEMLLYITVFTSLLLLWNSGLAFSSVLYWSLVFLTVHWIIVPTVFRLSPTLQRHIIFMNFVDISGQKNFDRPEKRGLPGTRNFFIETETNVKVGVWHIVPEPLISSVPAKGSSDYDSWFERSLSDDRPVVVYYHGNSCSRLYGHRVVLCDLLRKMDCHVIAVDYRGYGDSSSVQPTETGVVHDAKAVFKYIHQRVGSSPIFMWGHSLGTGISTHAAKDLDMEGIRLSGLVLESPFYNMSELLSLHPIKTILVGKVPFYDWFFVQPLATSDIAFCTNEHIASVKAPVIILHSKGDFMVPISAGRKLYETALRLRPENAPPVKFIEFESACGHENICLSPKFLGIVRDFFTEAIKGEN